MQMGRGKVRASIIVCCVEVWYSATRTTARDREERSTTYGRSFIFQVSETRGADLKRLQRQEQPIFGKSKLFNEEKRLFEAF